MLVMSLDYLRATTHARVGVVKFAMAVHAHVTVNFLQKAVFQLYFTVKCISTVFQYFRCTFNLKTKNT